jgi:hypothetical protein
MYNVRGKMADGKERKGCIMLEVKWQMGSERRDV